MSKCKKSLTCSLWLCILAFFPLQDTGNAKQGAKPPTANGGLPVVSPDGRHVAFFSNRVGAEGVYIIGVDGRGETLVARVGDIQGAPQWTRDGRVAFSTYENEVSHLFTVSIGGGERREIGSFPGRTPMLSPDGRRVVYMGGTWTATRLMVSGLDGRDAKQITDGTSIAWNSHWSPDARRIAYTGRQAANSELAVFVINADGSDPGQLTHIPADEGGAQWPVWSPGGKELAVQVNSRKDRKSAHIWLVDVALGNSRKLGSHLQPYLDETPSWFPDGKRIAYQSNRTGRMEVWIMKADGSGQRQLTGLEKQ